MLLVWVDDILAASGVTSALHILKEIHQFIELKMNGSPKHFVGMDMDVTCDRIFLSQTRYALSLPVDLPSKPIPNPLPTDILQEDDSSPVLSPSDATKYRSLLGAFAYLVLTRLDVCFAVSYFGRYNQAPTEKAYRLLVRAAQYAKSTAYMGINYPVRTANAFHLTAYSDASLASYRNNAMSGYLICLDGCPVSYRGGRQRKVRNSSTSAECEAMHDCLDTTLLLIYFIRQFKCTVKSTVYSDSMDLVKLLLSDHPKPLLKHMVIELRAMQDMLNISEREVRRLVIPILSLRDLFTYYPSDRIELVHLAGKAMPADAFTKPSDVHMLHTFMTCLSDIQRRESFARSRAKPKPVFIEYELVPQQPSAIRAPILIEPWSTSRLRDRSQLKAPTRLNL
jgi:hypothetical protein